MKKFTYSLLAVFFTAFVMSSCIDNAASSGVEAIRNAQAALLTAKAELEKANAAYWNARAAVETADAAYQDALTAQQDALNQEELVTLAKQQADAAVYLKDQELELEKSVDALAKYIAEKGLADAADYMDGYNTAMSSAYSTSYDIAAQNNWISVLQLYLADPNSSSGETWAQVMAAKAAQLHLDSVDLMTAQATWDAVQAVYKDPSTLQSLIDASLAKKLAIENSTDSTQVLKNAAIIIQDKAWTALSDLETTISDYQSDSTALANAEDALTTAKADSVAKQAEIDTRLQLLLVDYTAPLVANYSGVAAKRASAKALLLTVEDKFTEYDILVAQDAATPNDVTDVQIAAADTAVDVALRAYMAIVGGLHGSRLHTDDGYNAAANRLDNPIDISATATPNPADYQSQLALYAPVAAFFNFGQPAYDLVAAIGRYDANNFINDFEDADGVIADMVELDPHQNLTYDMDVLVQNIADAQAVIADKQSIVDAAQADYDAAVAGLDAAQTAYDDASTTVDDFQAVIDELYIVKGYNDDARRAYQAALDGGYDNNSQYYYGLNWYGNWLRWAVSNAQDNINQDLLDLKQTQFDETQATEELTAEQDYLTQLQTELAAYKAEAARYLALLTAALG